MTSTSTTQPLTFADFGLNDRLLRGITAAEFTTPTPIQSRAIPIALTGADLIGCAQTGTGKTAAFVIPILHRLVAAKEAQAKERSTEQKLQRGAKPARALILSPTRELVQQIEDNIRKLAWHMPLKMCSLYGGTSIDSQIRLLERGVDIIVATPGRLIDHLNRKSLVLSGIETLVLDEADRMLDMGFINDVRKIVAQTPPQRQTLLFSATMSPEIQAMTRAMQQSPALIEIGERRKPAESVTQHFYVAPQAQKMDLLLHVLKAEEMDSVIVFSRTKHGADRISRRLERSGLKAIAIHSNRTQSQRSKALAGFKKGQYKILVATDIAARGIDVDGISHVINFDTPPAAEDYIHRIGRTGRADATGDALTFVSRDEQNNVRKIERHIRKRLSVMKYPGFDYSAKPEDFSYDADDAAESEETPRRGERHSRNGRSFVSRSFAGRSSEGRSFEGRSAEGRSEARTDTRLDTRSATKHPHKPHAHHERSTRTYSTSGTADEIAGGHRKSSTFGKFSRVEKKGASKNYSRLPKQRV
jgi:ATP-dependent RNA helicase RhlE